MRDNNTIGKEANEALSTLIKELEQFTPAQINEAPFEGSWTAGELAEHMIMANSGFVKACNGTTEDTVRSVDEYEAGIRDAFLNFNIKMQSPDFIKPELKDYKKEELLSALKQIRSDVNTITANMDLTKTCTSFQIPVFGHLTRYEAICFVIYHTQRHIRQLSNIYSKLV